MIHEFDIYLYCAKIFLFLQRNIFYWLFVCHFDLSSSITVFCVYSESIKSKNQRKYMLFKKIKAKYNVASLFLTKGQK